MNRFLRGSFLFLLFYLSHQNASAQCNPVIYGEDTICAGSSSYLYVDNRYLSYSWSNGSTYNYTYATAAGTITLNTVDSSNCHGLATIIIRQVQPPTISFNANVAGYIATLNNTSTNAYSYEWIFGDGSTSSSVSPTHLYSVKGNYTVCLNSANNFCSAESYCKQVTVGTSLGFPTDSVFLKVFNTTLFNLNKVVQNPIDSGFLIAGQYDNCGECSSPMFIKTNKNGQVQWSRNFDYLYDVTNLEYFDSGYVFLSKNTDYSITKIDLNGNLVWQKYDGYFGDKLLFTFSNTRVGLIINKDPLEVVIYDENGNVFAQKSYTLGGWDMHFSSFAKSSDGNVLLNGEYGYNFPGPNGNHLLFDSYDEIAAKMDASGNFLWMNGIYQNTQVSANGEPLQNAAGEYLFPGKFYEPTASVYYDFITRFDGTGTYIDSWQIDSLNGEYSMWLSSANKVVVASRPVAPLYDSLRVVLLDDSFNIIGKKKITAYNCSRATKTYDGYLAAAFTYFDGATFHEFPSLYKTNITALSGCLDGNIPVVSYATFPYVYSFSLTSTTPAYTAVDTAVNSSAKNYDDSSLCRTCNVTASITLNGDTLICPGETVTLTAPANMYEYVWSTGEHTRTITVSTTGTYTVTVYDYRGCSASASKHITKGTQYNILFAINSPNGLCEGSSYSIHAYDSTFQSVYGTLWNTGDTGPFVYPTSSGTFAVTFTDQYGCATSDSVTVTLQPLPPVPNITGSVNVCAGDSVQLCATYTDNGSGPYTFSWNAGAFTNQCIYSQGGTYVVAITNRFGCDTASTSAHTVTSHPTPNPNIQPQDSAFFCPGGNVTLTAAGGFSQYHWSTNATTSSITVSSAGLYFVSVTDAFGCIGSENVHVYSGIAYNPVFSLDTTNGFCEGTQFILSVADSLSQPIANYSWSTSGTTSSITASASGTYSITLGDANGCTSSDSIHLQMHPVAPSVSISGITDVCAGSVATLCASFVDNNSGAYTYNWNSGAYSDSCIEVTSGTYQLMLTNSAGCSSSSSYVVTNHPLPVPNIQPSGTVLVCIGTDTLLCTDAGFASYAWTGGATTNCITALAGGYSVTVTDGFGCVGTDSVTVTDYQPQQPVVMSDAAPFDTLYSNAATGNQWYEVGVGAISGAVQNYFIPLHNGLYYVIVTDVNGCSSISSDTSNFNYVFIQTDFSKGNISIYPNPAHDVVTISFSGNVFSANEELAITLYDVTGRKVFESSSHTMPEIHLSLVEFAPAVYVVEIAGTNGKFISRIEKW